MSEICRWRPGRNVQIAPQPEKSELSTPCSLNIERMNGAIIIAITRQVAHRFPPPLAGQACPLAVLTSMMAAGASAPAARTWLSGGDAATRNVADIAAKMPTPSPRFSIRSRRPGRIRASRSLVLLSSLAPPVASGRLSFRSRKIMISNSPSGDGFPSASAASVHDIDMRTVRVGASSRATVPRCLTRTSSLCRIKHPASWTDRAVSTMPFEPGTRMYLARSSSSISP